MKTRLVIPILGVRITRIITYKMSWTGFISVTDYIFVDMFIKI